MKNQIRFVNEDIGSTGQVANCYLCEDLHIMKGTQIKKANVVMEIFNEQVGWVTFRSVCNKHKALAVKYMKGDD